MELDAIKAQLGMNGGMGGMGKMGGNTNVVHDGNVPWSWRPERSPACAAKHRRVPPVKMRGRFARMNAA